MKIIGFLFILPLIIRMLISMDARYKYGSAENALVIVIMAIIGAVIISQAT